jgi:hypothetical protein
MTDLQETKLRKCSSCKCVQVEAKYFEKNRKDQYMKTCITCRTKARNRPCNQPVKCPECDIVCSSAGNLKTHKKMVHLKIKDHECDQCDYKCSTSGRLKVHNKIVHLKIKDFECDQCDYKCSTADNLKVHKKMVHLKIKDFECDQCDYKCSTAGDLNAHKKICTGSLNISAGEFAVRNVLDSMDIEFETEVSILRNPNTNGWLRMDFKIEFEDKVLYIEYDGKQHFEPVCFGGISMEKAITNLEESKFKDSLKTEWCVDNDFPLLRIPYNKFGVIDQLVCNFMIEYTNWGVE